MRTGDEEMVKSDKSILQRAFDPLASYSSLSKELFRSFDLGKRTKSHLVFQMALYLNIWLYPFWFIVSLVSLDGKYHRLSDMYKVLTVTFFLVQSISEAIRIYLGYCGNLAGKIPELVSFWLVSSLIQFPLGLFSLCDYDTLPTIGETVTNCLRMFLLIGQIMTGTMALKSLSEHSARLFYLRRVYGLRNPLENNQT